MRHIGLFLCPLDIDIAYLTASIHHGVSASMVDRRTTTITIVRRTDNYIAVGRGEAAILLAINVDRIAIGIGTYCK